MNHSTQQRLEPTALTKPPRLGKPHRRPHGIFQISCTPDNSLVVHYRSESPSVKNWGDKTEDKQKTETGLLLREREWIDRVLKCMGQKEYHHEYQPQVLPRHEDESLDAYNQRKQAFESQWIKPFRFPVPIAHQIEKINHVDSSGQEILKPKLYWLPLDGYGTVGHIKETYTKETLQKARRQICERLGTISLAEASSYLLLAENGQYKLAPEILKPKKFGSLTSPPNFRTLKTGKPKPKRLATFTKRAAQKVRQGGGAIDKLCPKELVYFLTLTCPGSSAAAENTFRENLHIIKKRLADRILDRMKRNKCTIYSFYSVEIGQKGFKKCHIHWCIASPDWESEKMRALAHSMKDLWFKVLAEISDDIGVDLFERHSSGQKNNRINSWRDSPNKWQWKIEKVEKSVGAYLSKYASKAVAYSKRQSEFSLGEKGRDCPLKRWWGMNNKLREAIKSLSFKSKAMRIGQFNPELQELLREAIGCFEYELAYSKEYMILTDDKQFSLVNGQHDIYYVKSEQYFELLELLRDLECVFKAIESSQY